MTHPVPGCRCLTRAAHSPPMPHPKGGLVVGTYVHGYDLPYRSPSYAYIPAMRPALEASPDPWRHSATPIYDALYAEYRRLFRALPGDRSDEEDLGFVAFSAIGQPRGLTSGGHGGAWDTGGLYYRTYLPALPPGQRDGRY
ncbi:conserved hypothetical protein [Streptomyces himastatinicus ATCC 53653]|uniref:Uncharacterized protein n=2 Tax=Streptomyces violaceusniger group TaxID=2839105 RepID=D9WDM5_9ACTN|nr:conserved hypothetical protein [Streptomyces himastatinicus ATCC 53653]